MNRREPPTRSRNPGRRFLAGVMAIAALLTAPAWAGDRIVLPPGEAVEAWRGPVQLVGLELSADGRAEGGAVIRVERSSNGWVLRAQNSAGTVRTARIGAPATSLDREEVAFLAAALVRDLAKAQVGPPPRVVFVAPPPIAGASPIEARSAWVDPPEPKREVVSLPTADRPAPPLLPTASVWRDAPPPVLGPRGPLPLPPVVDVEPDPAPPRARRRVIIGVPPLSAGTTVLLRPGLVPGVAQWFGWDPTRLGRGTLSLRVSYTIARGLGIDFGRLYVSYGVRAGANFPLGRRSTLGLSTLGLFSELSWRVFRQQGQDILSVAIPTLGATWSGARIRMGRFSLGPDPWAAVDLGATRLILEDGSVVDLVPVEFGLGLQVRFRGAGDPSPEVPTSNR